MLKRLKKLGSTLILLGLVASFFTPLKIPEEIWYPGLLGTILLGLIIHLAGRIERVF